MKKNILLIAIVLIISGIASGQTSPPKNWQGGAEGGWYVNVPDDDTLNVRSLPSHTAKKVGIVEPGHEVSVLDTNSNGWKFIEAREVSGWVNGTYLIDAFTRSLEKSKNPTIQSKVSEKEKPEILNYEHIGSDKLSETISKTEEFEIEFKKYKNIFRNNDNCYRSLKRRAELVGLSMQLEQNDPVTFRNLKNKFDECMGTIDLNTFEPLEKKVKGLAISDAQKIRFSNFSREYTSITEDALGLLQLGQMMGISYE